MMKAREYENYLRKKNITQLRQIIYRLRKKIRETQYEMELARMWGYSPKKKEGIAPGRLIFYSRKRLELAKRILLHSGGVYRPTKADRFQQNIAHISRICFRIGSWDSIDDQYEMRFSDTGIDSHIGFGMWICHSDEPVKKSFLSKFGNLHIGEWRDTYRIGDYPQVVEPFFQGGKSKFKEPVTVKIMDGVQWELSIEYNNGIKPVSFGGDNAYPYNFDKLHKLFRDFTNKVVYGDWQHVE